MAAKQTFDDKDLIRNGSADENDAVPTTHGWHVRYWGPGLNLLFYHRLESGKVVGVLVPRSRWIADLIAELPETALPVGSRDGFASEARIRLVNSNGDVVYQWGAFEPDDTAKAFAELPLCNPLSSWRLEYFVDAERFAAVGRSAYWNLFSALAAIGLGLIVVAASFYREYACEMREAVQRVNFVNQVSHELKTPLTNIRMYAELLEADLDLIDCEEVATPRGHLQVIVTESQRLSRLIGNVLTFARQRRNQLSLRKTTARVDEVIAAVIECFRPTFRQKGIEVVFDAAASAPVKVDADALEQILGNLINHNPIYSSSAPGKRHIVQLHIGLGQPWPSDAAIARAHHHAHTKCPPSRPVAMGRSDAADGRVHDRCGLAGDLWPDAAGGVDRGRERVSRTAGPPRVDVKAVAHVQSCPAARASSAMKLTCTFR